MFCAMQTKSIHLVFMVVLGLVFTLLVSSGLCGFETNQSAGIVVGQPDMTSNQINQGTGTAANTLAYAYAITTDGFRFFIADCNNHRILIFNTIPSSHNASADVVIGQPNMTGNQVNQGTGPAANTLYYPRGVFTDGARLFISDVYNNRVLIFNTIPSSNNASADVVIGQPNMTSNQANQGMGTAANTLEYPYAVGREGARLFIADTGNHRVLIFNTVPLADNASATLVVGQPDFISNAPNQGTPAGTAANFLCQPCGVYSDGTRFIIADTYNHRILIFNTFPLSNDAGADVVVGQPDMFSNQANQGLSPSANTLRQSYLVAGDGSRLFISDCYNHRVLLFNTIPTVNNAGADVVIGQPDMTSTDINQGNGPTDNSLYYPHGIFFHGSRLFIGDCTNHRVLLHDEIFPTPSVTSPSLGVPFFQVIQGVVRISRGESAMIRINLSQTTRVQMRIYNLAGRRIATVLDGPLAAGIHEILWDGAGAGSGTYFVYLEAESKHARGKLVLIR